MGPLAKTKKLLRATTERKFISESISGLEAAHRKKEKRSIDNLINSIAPTVNIHRISGYTRIFCRFPNVFIHNVRINNLIKLF